LNPQLSVGCCVHSSSSSKPAATVPQKPLAPECFFWAVHAEQVLLHALLQHTPSAQKPLSHSTEELHDSPRIFFSVHALAWHVKGTQLCAPPSMQCPLSSHESALNRVTPSSPHCGGAHSVPPG
jgi:hypothetical protein